MIDDNHLLANGTRVDLCWAGWFVWQQREWEATALWMDERMLQWRSSILMTTNSFFAEAGVVWTTNLVAGKGAELELRKCGHWYVTSAALAFASSFFLRELLWLPARSSRQDNLFGWAFLFFMLWCFHLVLDAAPKLMLMAQPWLIKALGMKRAKKNKVDCTVSNEWRGRGIESVWTFSTGRHLYCFMFEHFEDHELCYSALRSDRTLSRTTRSSSIVSTTWCFVSCSRATLSRCVLRLAPKETGFILFPSTAWHLLCFGANLHTPSLPTYFACYHLVTWSLKMILAGWIE